MNNNPRLRLFQWTALILLAGALVCTNGCTSPGSSVEVKQSPVFNPAKYKTIAVDVAVKDTDFNELQKLQLIDFIQDRLRKSGKFDKVYVDTPSLKHEVDMKLSVTVEFVVGPNFNRTQHIETSVTLISCGDGKTLASAAINADTGWAFFGTNMKKAIDRLSTEIVSYTINGGKSKVTN